MAFEENVEKSLLSCLKAASPDFAVSNFGTLELSRCDFGAVNLLVACSGGIDSTALLLALCALRDKNPEIILRAAHVNHGLRGKESDLDERFCVDLCSIYSIPLVVKRLNLEKPVSAKARISEERLRKARYQALLEAASELSCQSSDESSAPYVVTAHNLDDQVETMLFRLARGTSARGLSGIAEARPLDQSGVMLIRPLLNCSRLQIESYLAERGVSGRLDASNRVNDYNRNFLRNVVLPPLKERFPAILTNMERLRRTIASDNEYLDEQAARLLTEATLSGLEKRAAENIWPDMETGNPPALRADMLASVHPALCRRALAAYLQNYGVEPSLERIERVQRLLDMAGQKQFETRLTLGENFALIVSKNCILLKPENGDVPHGNYSEAQLQALQNAFAPLAVKVPEPGQGPVSLVIDWMEKILVLTPLSGASGQEPYTRHALSLEVDLTSFVATGLEWRTRRPQDHLQPLGMDVDVRLKKYLQVNKSFCLKAALLPGLAPALAQRLWPVLARDSEILWVPGVGLSEKLRHNGRPSHLIELRAQF